MADKIAHTPSLIEAQSQGGDTAETGFDFQTNLILCKIPFWLSHEGFDSLIREGIADFEMKIFIPREGNTREALEAKNHHVAPKEFWEEIERFREIDQGSPGTFSKYTICCVGISEDLKPLINGLRRIREPLPFYDQASAIEQNSYSDFIERVNKLGKDADMARFLFEKVLIEPSWNLVSDEQTAKGVFQDQVLRHLPEFEDLSAKVIGSIYQVLLELLRAHKARPLTRLKIEQAIDSILGDKTCLSYKPTIITTEIDEVNKKTKALQMEWADFFGGNTRQYPPTEEWNAVLIPQLTDTLKWIKENRNVRKVKLKGSRRISAALAFGYHFSAVSGMKIDMEYREEIWATDDHPNPNTPDYSITSSYQNGTADNLIVTIGIMKEHLANEVNQFIQNGAVNDQPLLNIYSDQPIVSAKQANSVVMKIKQELERAIRHHNVHKIDLYYAGPTHLAVFLGHRFNTLPPIQCYEWTENNVYVPTCLLQQS